MNKKITVFSFVTIFGLVLSFTAYTNSSGAPARRSGSPASVGTCAAAGCHSGPAISTETITIVTDIPATGFVENQDYNITITADDGGRGLVEMGFQASIESPAGSEGSLTSPASDTRLVGSGAYITHSFSGITANGSRTWDFVWNSGTAPDQTTIYTAVNFSNNNGSTNGDAIGTAQLALTKNASIGLEELSATAASLYPNPAQTYFEIENFQAIEGDLSIISLSGQVVRTIPRAELGSSIYIADLKPGVYMIRDNAGDFSTNLSIAK